MTGIRAVFKQRHFLYLWALLPVAGLLFLLVQPKDACAQTAAPSSCDAEYYDTLRSQAWMQAQREITQNQNLIFKPDSVLEYTCFDQHLMLLASEARNMFSENPRWGTSGIGSMATSLANLSGRAFVSYLLANFEMSAGGEYDLLGGRLDGLDYPAGDFDAAQIAGDIADAAVSGHDYNCDIMNQVWMEAKCWDFIADEDHDGFFSLADYAGFDSDRRFLPAVCEPYVTQTQWEESYAMVRSTDVDETPWVEDPLLTYLDRLAPETCAAAVPISTGLLVRTPNGEEFPERVCIPAGCNYTPPANGTGVGTCTP